MQQRKEYPQIYELGLGSLIGDFFENVRDVVGDVAKKVAPIAPFLLPFIPGLSSMQQLGIGAGLNLAAGQKPVDVAKNLAIQTALTGIKAGFGNQTPTPKVKLPVAQGGGPNMPFLSNMRADPSGIASAAKDSSSFFGNFKDSTADFFTDGMGARLNPFSDASKMQLNSNYSGFSEKDINSIMSDPLQYESLITKLGMPMKERSFLGKYGPAMAAAGVASLPFLTKTPDMPEEEEYEYVPNEYYYGNELAYQLPDIVGPQGYIPDVAMAANGGEINGFAAGSGVKIEHPNGRVREHPRRIGEISGAGNGTSDDIPAMLSDGEFVMTAQAVRNAGGGSRKEGAKRMYQMMKNLEKGGSVV